jgi:hypothetical protein
VMVGLILPPNHMSGGRGNHPLTAPVTCPHDLRSPNVWRFTLGACDAAAAPFTNGMSILCTPNGPRALRVSAVLDAV